MLPRISNVPATPGIGNLELLYILNRVWVWFNFWGEWILTSTQRRVDHEQDFIHSEILFEGCKNSGSLDSRHTWFSRHALLWTGHGAVNVKPCISFQLKSFRSCFCSWLGVEVWMFSWGARKSLHFCFLPGLRHKATLLICLGPCTAGLHVCTCR